MSHLRLPLYAKLIGWLSLNLLLVLSLAFAFAPTDQTGLNLLLTPSVREHLHAVAHAIAEDLVDVPEAEWPAVLAQRTEDENVTFSARQRPPPGLGPFGPAPPGSSDVAPLLPRIPSGGPDGMPFGGPANGPPAPGMDIRRAADQAGYDVRSMAFIGRRGSPPFVLEISAHAPNVATLIRLLGFGHEISFVAAVLCLSALLWWPFVWHITRSIRRMAVATSDMSRGRLETRVLESRRDELGELATSINVMAERLQRHLQGQQQFIADVAHEVISPVARMQIGVGILEAYVADNGAAALVDVREDLEMMAEILNDLLLFSKTGIQAGRAPLTRVDLVQLVQRVVAAEAGDTAVTIDMPPGIPLETNNTMLTRALSNLVRNACRYAAGGTQPIEVTGRVEGDAIYLAVRDRGPGVPESALARLGEPFFRPELSRSRASGGFGLGLAIVKRCVGVCNGEVTFRNRSGGGFEAEIVLPLAATRGAERG